MRLGRATYLKVLYDGRRGDHVRLGRTASCQVSLRGPDGEPVSRTPSGFWRLADSGQYLYTLTRCEDLENSTRVLLEKLRYVAVRTDAVEGESLPAARGFVDVFRVRVPASGRLQARVHGGILGHGIEGMVLPNGAWHPFNGLISGETLYFEDGRPIASRFGRLHGAGGTGALVTRAGDLVTLVARGRLTAFASVAQPLSAVIDAPATTLLPSATPYRQYQVEFDACSDRTATSSKGRATGDDMTRHEVSATGPWVAEASVADELHCDRRSNGCGDWGSDVVGPDTATSVQFGMNGPFVALLEAAAGVNASVELSVSPAS